MGFQGGEVGSAAGEKIVYAQYMRADFKESGTEMATNEASATGDRNRLTGKGFNICQAIVQFCWISETA